MELYASAQSPLQNESLSTVGKNYLKLTFPVVPYFT